MSEDNNATSNNSNSRNRRRGKKGNGGNQKSTGNTKNYRAPAQTGACEELKSNVYTVGDSKSADKYAKTTEEISNYILREYKHGSDIVKSLENMTFEDMDKYKPQDLPEKSTPTKLEREVLRQEVKEYLYKKGTFDTNKVRAYGLILGQQRT